MKSLELGDLPHGYLSFSSYSQYLRCPYQFYLRHVEGLKEPPKGAFILGRGVHAGLEWSFNETIKTNQTPSGKAVQEAAVSAIEDEFKSVAASDVEWSNGDNVPRIKDDSVRLLGVYDPVRSTLHPKHVEKSFEIKFSNTDLQLQGRIDLETREKAVIDFKTTTRTPAPSLADSSEQLTLYQVQAEAPQSLEIHALIRKKAPEYQILKSAPRTQREVDGTLQNIQKVALLIRAGIFPKTLEGVPGSPCSWCGYYERCRGKKRPDKSG